MPVLLEQLAEKISASFDLSGVFDEKTLSRTRNDLIQAGFAAGERAWLSFTLFAALLAFFASVFLLLAASLEILCSLALAFLAFALVFLLFLKYPYLAKKKRAQEIEVSLSIALRSASIELNSGTPFEKVLENAAERNENALGKEFSVVVREVRRGSGVPRALRNFGERVDSVAVKRAVMQFCFAYEHGLKGEGLRRLADELIALQKTRAKEFAAKQAFFGLLFIALACIVPALFAAYVIIGSSFMELTFGANEVLFAFALLFPLCDTAMLVYLREKTPRVLA